MLVLEVKMLVIGLACSSKCIGILLRTWVGVVTVFQSSAKDLDATVVSSVSMVTMCLPIFLRKVEFIVSCAFLPLIKTVVVTPRLPLFLCLLLWRGPNRFRFFLLNCRLIDSDHQVLEISM